jgi:hypothetical protein
MDPITEPREDATPLLSGPWMRHARYEIREGEHGRRMVAPAPGAQLSIVNPWKAHDLAAREGADPPWLKLVLVGRAVTEREQRAAVLHFVNRYGLLGLLPHAVSRIVLAPRWENHPSLPPDKQIEQTVMSRGVGGCGWEAVEFPHLLEGDEAKSDSLIELSRARGLEEPHAEIRWWNDSSSRRSRLSEALWPYFAAVVPAAKSETYAYPLPLSRQFFSQYAEPFGEIVEVARAFADAIETAQADGDLHLLDYFLSANTPAGERDREGRLRARFVANSLVSMCAICAVQELGGKWLRRCEGCGELYLGEQINARFRPGHQQCAARIRKRDQRAEAAKAKRAKRRGATASARRTKR